MSTYPTSLEEDSCLKYGAYIQSSPICPLCKSQKSNEINLLRAKDHLTIKEITLKIGASEKDVKRHFEKHYRVNSTTQQILSIKENLNPEAQDIITKIFDGDTHLVSAVQGVLKSQAERLLDIKERIKNNIEEYDMKVEDENNTKDFILLNDQAGKIEKNILESYKVIDNKLYSASQGDLSRAIVEYKLKYLQKVMDAIIVVFKDHEKKSPESATIVYNIKKDLAQHFDFLELEVIKSGGTMFSEQKTIDVIATPTDTSEGEVSS